MHKIRITALLRDPEGPPEPALPNPAHHFVTVHAHREGDFRRAVVVQRIFGDQHTPHLELDGGFRPLEAGLPELATDARQGQMSPFFSRAFSSALDGFSFVRDKPSSLPRRVRTCFGQPSFRRSVGRARRLPNFRSFSYT
jgi:hypothetical protein